VSERATRKKRKERRHTASASSAPAPAPSEPTEPDAEGDMTRAYARSRARDEAARAALVPLEPGERPTAVTVAAIVAMALLVANLIALFLGFDPDEPRKAIPAVLGIVILGACAWGMWRVRYWAVLGMQTIMALAVVGASIALIDAGNLLAVVLVLAIIVSCGTVFWFLVKAMARIQMPERPGAG